MSEARECPFCRAPGNKYVDSAGYWQAECIKCGAAADAHSWDQRPIEDELRVRVAALEAALKQAQAAGDLPATAEAPVRRTLTDRIKALEPDARVAGDFPKPQSGEPPCAPRRPVEMFEIQSRITQARSTQGEPDDR